jgi:flagellar biosynthetic protein FlhB
LGDQPGDKSEEPTPHKLREARKKGQIAKSKEITAAILVIATYQIFKGQAQKMWLEIVAFSEMIFRMIPDARDNFSEGSSVSLIYMSITNLIQYILPLLISVFVIALLAELMQTRFLYSTESVKPKLEKINPISGFKRLFSMKGLVMILINLAKIGIVFYITWTTISESLAEIITSMTMTNWQVMVFTGGLVMKIATRVALFYLFIAMLDYFYQRHAFHKQMMMSKQEIKEEYKRLEGDPIIKQRQRQAQREMSQRRMMGNVPGADVVVTNPTHIACALKYDTENMRAPILVAKGMRIIAEEIRRIADQEHIPIVENVALARSLYETTELNDEIPFELYKAVAEVLAFVYKLKNGRKQRNNL